jgi:hypothetical protein
MDPTEAPPQVSSLGQASSLHALVNNIHYQEKRDLDPWDWILQNLCLTVVSSLGQASSLHALVNNIIYQEERDLDPWDWILQKLRLPVVSSLGGHPLVLLL